MAQWVKITNVREFLSSGTIRYGVHSFGKRMVLSWPFCDHCGLVLLKNEATRKALKQPCARLED